MSLSSCIFILTIPWQKFLRTIVPQWRLGSTPPDRTAWDVIWRGAIWHPWESGRRDRWKYDLGQKKLFGKTDRIWMSGGNIRLGRRSSIKIISRELARGSPT